MAKQKNSNSTASKVKHGMVPELVAAQVENPFFSRDHGEVASNARKIHVIKNARESAVEMLFARGGLDLAQKQVADKLRHLGEQCGGAGSPAFDYAREIVDGGGAVDPISERQLIAGYELAKCRKLLGARLYRLTYSVCVEGFSLKDVAPAQRDRLTAADNLRASLDDLGAMWGVIRRV